MSNRLRSLIIAEIALILLTGCEAATDLSDRLVPAGWGLCPVLKDYSEAELARSADALEQEPETSILVTMIADYSLLRDQVRVCQSEPKT